jgi:hypothetical protein
MMLTMGTIPMTTRMGNSEPGRTGFTFELHVLTAFPSATTHRPQGLMGAGQHLMAMDSFQFFLVLINQLGEENRG